MTVLLATTGLPLLAATGTVALPAAAGGDVTAPTLSSPTDAADGATASTGSVSTNEGNGTLYWVITSSGTAPSAAQVKAGQDDGGSAAADSGSQAVSSTGVKNIAGSGLTAETAYFTHFMHEDAATNQSAVASADGFTTDAAAGEWNGTLLGPTTSIVHRGVTFTFADAVRYIEGPAPLSEPILISHADYLPSGTSWTGSSPASAVVDTYIAHGAMLNPLVNTSADSGLDVSGGQTFGQGFDEAMSGGDPASDNEAMTYVSGMNIDPGQAGAFSIPTGYKGTIIKSVRDTSISNPSGTENSGIVEKYVRLTIMDSLPPSEGVWFPPAASLESADMEWRHKVETVDAKISSVLRSLARPTGFELASWYLTNRVIADEMQVIPFWAEGQGDRTRRLQLSKEEPVGNAYSRDLGQQRARIACALHFDPAADQTEIDAKRDLAVYLTQWGIDMEGARLRGMLFRTGAGQNFGKQQWAYIAGFLLGDAPMLTQARLVRGNSINQCWWVTAEHVGYPVEENHGSAGSNAKILGETYDTEDVGVPEWSSGGWDPETPAGGVKAPKISWNLSTLYRDVIFTTQFLELIPVCLLQSGPSGETGDDAIRDGDDYSTANPRAGCIAHMDRLITIEPWQTASTTGNLNIAKNLYNDWRGEYVATTPLWVGRPDIPYNPVDDPDWSVGAAGAGEIDWDFTPFDYATEAITDQQAQVSHDNVQFTDVTEIAAGNALGTAQTGTLTGLRPGVTNLRWRRQSAAGWSRWSPTWWMVHSTSSNAAYDKYKTNRNEHTIPGTASGTFTEVAAPALQYKPFPASDEASFYLPVTGGTDLAQIETLYAGLGYYTGGSGAITGTYVWQRSTDGSTVSDANIGTGKSYSRVADDIGNYVRCQITPAHGGGSGATVTTAWAQFPAAQTFDPSYLVKTTFDAMFEYEWPTIDSNISFSDCSKDHRPAALYDNTAIEYKGGMWGLKTGTDPHITFLITSSLAEGTYHYKIVASFGQLVHPTNSEAYPADDDHVLYVAESFSGSSPSGTVWVQETQVNGTDLQPAAYVYEGDIVISGADVGKAMRVRHHNTYGSGGIGGGSPGLLYLEIQKTA